MARRASQRRLRKQKNGAAAHPPPPAHEQGYMSESHSFCSLSTSFLNSSSSQAKVGPEGEAAGARVPVRLDQRDAHLRSGRNLLRQGRLAWILQPGRRERASRLWRAALATAPPVLRRAKLELALPSRRCPGKLSCSCPACTAPPAAGTLRRR